jgi:hypothetical protein
MALRQTMSVPEPLGNRTSSATLAHLAIPERGILVHFDCSGQVPVETDNGVLGRTPHAEPPLRLDVAGG